MPLQIAPVLNKAALRMRPYRSVFHFQTGAAPEKPSPPIVGGGALGAPKKCFPLRGRWPSASEAGNDNIRKPLPALRATLPKGEGLLLLRRNGTGKPVPYSRGDPFCGCAADCRRRCPRRPEKPSPRCESTGASGFIWTLHPNCNLSHNNLLKRRSPQPHFCDRLTPTFPGNLRN